MGKRQYWQENENAVVYTDSPFRCESCGKAIKSGIRYRTKSEPKFKAYCFHGEEFCSIRKLDELFKIDGEEYVEIQFLTFKPKKSINHE